MVFYEVDIKMAKGAFGVISFESSSTTYVSGGSATPLAFSFEFEDLSSPRGLLGFTDGVIFPTNFIWPIPSSTFPPGEFTVFFQPGDCIHVRNMDPVNSAALRIANFTTSIPTVSTSLAPGEDTWILWQGKDSLFSSKPCCVHPETEVMTVSGPVQIKDLKMDNKVIDQNGNKVTILKNIKSITTKNFIKIPAGSIAENVPSKDLLIKASHPILLEGKEVDPESLIKENKGVERVTLDKSEHVWTLVTKKSKFIMMDGVPVKTWSWKNWHSRVRKDPSMVFWEQ